MEDIAYKLAIYIKSEGMGEDFGLVAHEGNGAVMSQKKGYQDACATAPS